MSSQCERRKSQCEDHISQCEDLTPQHGKRTRVCKTQGFSVFDNKRDKSPHAFHNFNPSSNPMRTNFLYHKAPVKRRAGLIARQLPCQQRHQNVGPHHAAPLKNIFGNGKITRRGKRNQETKISRFNSWSDIRKTNRRIWRQVKSSGSEALMKLIAASALVRQFKKLTCCMIQSKPALGQEAKTHPGKIEIISKTICIEKAA